MKVRDVDSSTLRSAGYDPERELLQLEFQNGKIYQYFEVPPGTYNELLEAESKGAYFNHYIRDKFKYAQVKAAAKS